MNYKGGVIVEMWILKHERKLLALMFLTIMCSCIWTCIQTPKVLKGGCLTKFSEISVKVDQYKNETDKVIHEYYVETKKACEEICQEPKEGRYERNPNLPQL